MQEKEDLLTDELEITDTLKKHLTDIAGWAKILSVVALISCGFMLAGALFTGFYISRVMHYRYGFSFGPAISALYIFFAVVWFFPSVLLYRFSLKLNAAIKNNIQEDIDEAFLDLKSLFKFLGIGTILILSLWIISFLLLLVKAFSA